MSSLSIELHLLRSIVGLDPGIACGTTELGYSYVIDRVGGPRVEIGDQGTLAVDGAIASVGEVPAEGSLDSASDLNYLVVLIDTQREERHNHIFQPVTGGTIVGDCDRLVERIYLIPDDTELKSEVVLRIGGLGVSEEMIDVAMVAREFLDCAEELYRLRR